MSSSSIDIPSTAELGFECNQQDMTYYKLLFRVADPGRQGFLSIPDMAQFLKKSGLQQQDLKTLWSLSCASSPQIGFRDFCVAMRLISIAQAGMPVSQESLTATSGKSLALPQITGLPNSTAATVVPPAADPSSTSTNSGNLARKSSSASTGSATSQQQASGLPNNSWAIPADIKKNYEKFFSQQKLTNGVLSSSDGAAFLAQSGLPITVLQVIWGLSDYDKDGNLTLEEFCIAMHLTVLAKRGIPLPEVLPNELLPKNVVGNKQEDDPFLQITPQSPVHSRPPPEPVPVAVAAPMVPHPPRPAPAVPVVPPSPMMMSSSSSSENLALNQSLSQIDASIQASTNALKNEITHSKAEIDALKAEREYLMSSIQEGAELFQKTQAEVSKLESELMSLRESIKGLRMDLKNQNVKNQELLDKKVTLLDEKAAILSSRVEVVDTEQQQPSVHVPKRPAPHHHQQGFESIPPRQAPQPPITQTDPFMPVVVPQPPYPPSSSFAGEAVDPIPNNISAPAPPPAAIGSSSPVKKSEPDPFATGFGGDFEFDNLS